MERPQRNASGDDGRAATLRVPDVRDYFIFDVAVVLLVAHRFCPPRHPWVQPAFGVDGVDGEDLALPRFDLRADGFDHVEPFVLQVVRRCRREHQKCETIGSVHRNFHFAVKAWAVPRVKGSLHKRNG